MCCIYVQMMKSLGLLNRFVLPDEIVFRYADAVSLKYRHNPYHNFYHGFGITQFLFAVYRQTSLVSEILGLADVLALFVASLVHDADHPGNNNAWEVATHSALALRYNDTAVLENHHAAIGLEIMQSPSSNMFNSLEAKQFNEVREMYVHAVLQTDMAQHFQMVAQLKVLKGEALENCKSLEERRFIVGLLLHSVDISNPLIPKFDLCRKWAEGICAEFWGQYEKELAANVPPTQMWADINTLQGFYKSQVGFINFIVSPLWNMVAEFFPDLQQQGRLLDNVERNKQQWTKLLEEEGKKAKSEEDEKTKSREGE